jgi:hypothetical protein
MACIGRIDTVRLIEYSKVFATQNLKLIFLLTLGIPYTECFPFLIEASPFDRFGAVASLLIEEWLYLAPTQPDYMFQKRAGAGVD